MRLGFANVDKMLASISGAQLAEWEAFYQLEPFGTEDEWAKAALIASTIANTVPRKKGSKKQGFKPSDFMPDFEKAVQEKLDRKYEKSEQAEKAKMQALMAKWMHVVAAFSKEDK